MDPAAIVALVGVIITLPLSIVALIQAGRANSIARRSSAAAERAAKATEEQAKATEEQAKASVEQTEIQRALSRRGAEPSLWADIRVHEDHAALLILLVGNSGPTVATDVVVTFDPPLHTAAWVDNYALRGEERLNAGLSSLPPDRTLRWEMAVLPLAPKLFQGVTPPSYAVTIKANGPFGALEPLTYTIDLGDIENCLKTATGTLYGITRAVADLGKSARVIEENVARGMTVAVSDHRE